FCGRAVGLSPIPTNAVTPGVETILRFTKLEAPKYKAMFTVGDAVRITDGPFAEFLGTVDEINEEKGKVKILVSVFGRETPVELDFLQVKQI
ncbi:MAG TPA: KOW motif-containing protein, partial [Patescibacteria group bacterium]|nr:KOW motif-containing protein [Patescibacteria group bacterium]